MSKHTPGPWEIRAEDPDEEYWITEPHYTVGATSIVFNIEDACLISAAPDLLEALKQMCDAFLDTEGTHGSVEQAATDLANAAIKKAEGKA